MASKGRSRRAAVHLQWVAVTACFVLFASLPPVVEVSSSFLESERTQAAQSHENTAQFYTALDDLLTAYETAPHLSEEQERYYLELRANLRKTQFVRMDHQWLPDYPLPRPVYYEHLSTEDLAIETLCSPVYFSEMQVFDDPMVVVCRLTECYPGFAELFAREDLRDGLLAAYEENTRRIDVDMDSNTLMDAASNLRELAQGLVYVPAFRDQVRGREEAFVRAHVRALRRFQAYIQAFEPKEDGLRGVPFETEAVQVALAGLVFLRQFDAVSYEATRVRLGREFFAAPDDRPLYNLRSDDLERFLSHVLHAFEYSMEPRAASGLAIRDSRK